MNIPQRTDDFLAALASGSPTPGGGGAAALMASLGAALVAMVCRLTEGRPGFDEVQGLIGETIGMADDLRQRALALVEEDAAAYEAVSAAYALPRATPDEKAYRTGQVRTALMAATQPPLRIAQIAVDVLHIAAGVAGKSNPNIASDLGVAGLSALAALESALLNVRENARLAKDSAFTAGVTAQAATWNTDASALYAVLANRVGCAPHLPVH